jgi:hypothetical protein
MRCGKAAYQSYLRTRVLAGGKLKFSAQGLKTAGQSPDLGLAEFDFSNGFV